MLIWASYVYVYVYYSHSQYLEPVTDSHTQGDAQTAPFDAILISFFTGREWVSGCWIRPLERFRYVLGNLYFALALNDISSPQVSQGWTSSLVLYLWKYLQYSTYCQIVVHKVSCLKLWTLRLYCLDILPEYPPLYQIQILKRLNNIAVNYIERSCASCILRISMDRSIDIFEKRKNRESCMGFVRISTILLYIGLRRLVQ